MNIHLHFSPPKAKIKTYEVESYFPVRRNCLVTLYQDAHALDVSQMPQFESFLSHMKQNKNLTNEDIAPRSCWKDLYYSLIEAKHIICITGWSVWHKLKLLRGDDRMIDRRSLGEILAERAKNGVDVYVMIWLDMLGQMGTHCYETYYYFKNTNVRCALVPRQTSVHDWIDMPNHVVNKRSFSHHQKSRHALYTIQL